MMGSKSIVLRYTALIAIWSLSLSELNCSTSNLRPVNHTQPCTCDYPVFTSYFQNTYCGNITACYSSLLWYMDNVPTYKLPRGVPTIAELRKKITDIWERVPIFELKHFEPPCGLTELDVCRDMQDRLLEAECKRVFPNVSGPIETYKTGFIPINKWTHWGRPEGTWLWGAYTKKHKESAFRIKGKPYWKDGCPDVMNYPTFTFLKLARESDSRIHYDEYKMLEEYVPQFVPLFIIKQQVCRFMEVMTQKTTRRFPMSYVCKTGILKQVICPNYNTTEPFNATYTCRIPKPGQPISITYPDPERV